MSALASSSVTWGISGPTFLVGYGLLALAVLLGVFAARRQIAAGSASTAARELDGQPHDIAYLNGGPELAVLSALSSMRVAGTVVAEGRGRIRAEGQPATSASELERAVHLAAAPPMARYELLRNGIVRTALENTRRRLEDAGLLLSAEQQRRIRLLALWRVAVTVLGLARLVAGVANGAPVGFLVLELLAVGIVAAILLIRVPKRSRRGTARLKALRGQHTELDPKMRPNWAAYGPAHAALGVGAAADDDPAAAVGPRSWLAPGDRGTGR